MLDAGYRMQDAGCRSGSPAVPYPVSRIQYPASCISHPARSLQQLLDLSNERIGRKWLLEERRRGRELALPDERVAVRRRRVEHPETRSLAGQALCERGSVHSVHHDVREEQIDAARVLARQL